MLAILQATAVSAPAPVSGGVSVNLTTSDILLLVNAAAAILNTWFHIRRVKK
jgi:hypothetical protein